ncbi:MAG TPA: hypothetical protein VFJ30_12550 [Phycisphaerae bacterium]|nr:hypothetical protein [Phycisphaerae bacterium]
MGEYTGSGPEAYADKPIEPVILKQTVQRLIKKSAAGALAPPRRSLAPFSPHPPP